MEEEDFYEKAKKWNNSLGNVDRIKKLKIYTLCLILIIVYFYKISQTHYSRLF